VACDAGAARLARLRAGEALEYGYDVYGSGRVAWVIAWDAAAATFVESRTDRYVDGGCDTSTRPIDEAEALRHVRAAAQG
jgi:hypothetical protein